MHIPAMRAMKLFVTLAFAAASLAGVSANAQAPASTAPVGSGIPAAPAEGIDPSTLPDIQGIHLGMMAQDMLPKLAALYPGKGGPSQAGVNPVNVRYIQAPNRPWIGDIYGTGSTTSDSFTATFTGPPNKQVAVYLMRALGFQSGRYPLPDALIAALKQKYGPNPTMKQPAVLCWAYDEQGHPVAMPVSKTTSCATNQLLAPVNSINTYLPGGAILPMVQADVNHWLAMKCGTGVIVVASLNLTNPGNGGPLVVASMVVTIIENGEDLRDAFVGQSYIVAAAAAARQQQLKNAQQQKVGPL